MILKIIVLLAIIALIGSSFALNSIQIQFSNCLINYGGINAIPSNTTAIPYYNMPGIVQEPALSSCLNGFPPSVIGEIGSFKIFVYGCIVALALLLTYIFIKGEDGNNKSKEQNQGIQTTNNQEDSKTTTEKINQ